MRKAISLPPGGSRELEPWQKEKKKEKSAVPFVWGDDPDSCRAEKGCDGLLMKRGGEGKHRPRFHLHISLKTKKGEDLQLTNTGGEKGGRSESTRHLKKRARDRDLIYRGALVIKPNIEGIGTFQCKGARFLGKERSGWKSSHSVWANLSKKKSCTFLITGEKFSQGGKRKKGTSRA